MKEMSIDLETYSDVDIKKCGAYKYAESDNFEILLFGVSIDGGEVQVFALPVAIPFPMISLQHYLMVQLQSGLSMPILKESVYPTGLENITLRISKATVFRKILLPNIWIQPHGSVPWYGQPIWAYRSPLKVSVQSLNYKIRK